LAAATLPFYRKASRMADYLPDPFLGITRAEFARGKLRAARGGIKKALGHARRKCAVSLYQAKIDALSQLIEGGSPLLSCHATRKDQRNAPGPIGLRLPGKRNFSCGRDRGAFCPGATQSASLRIDPVESRFPAIGLYGGVQRAFACRVDAAPSSSPRKQGSTTPGVCQRSCRVHLSCCFEILRFLSLIFLLRKLLARQLLHDPPAGRSRDSSSLFAAL